MLSLSRSLYLSSYLFLLHTLVASSLSLCVHRRISFAAPLRSSSCLPFFPPCSVGPAFTSLILSVGGEEGWEEGKRRRQSEKGEIGGRAGEGGERKRERIERDCSFARRRLKKRRCLRRHAPPPRFAVTARNVRSGGLVAATMPPMQDPDDAEVEDAKLAAEDQVAQARAYTLNAAAAAAVELAGAKRAAAHARK